jgi:hypothetical protein
MRRRKQHGGATIEFALVSPLLISLIIGTMMYGTELMKETELQQVTRDVASMVARGTDFTLTSNQTLIARLGQELGWPPTGWKTDTPGVVYVSTIEYLDGTCNGYPGGCANASHWVFTASLAFGNTSGGYAFRKSNYGAPAACLPACLDAKGTAAALNNSDSLTNTNARVNNFNLLGTPATGTPGFQPGQLAYLVEAAAITGPWGGGQVSYAYSLF